VVGWEKVCMIMKYVYIELANLAIVANGDSCHKICLKFLLYNEDLAFGG
jgi:hypothetical protein